MKTTHIIAFAATAVTLPVMLYLVYVMALGGFSGFAFPGDLHLLVKPAAYMLAGIAMLSIAGWGIHRSNPQSTYVQPGEKS